MSATSLQATILGVSLWGPGLEGWDASRPILAGETPYQPGPSPPPPPALLQATERRRAGPVVRLALAVAHEAAQSAAIPPGQLRAVFASANGDGPVVGGILDALATAAGQRVVSPTQFHNSVHNAAAGYWSIATGSHLPATCIGCHDQSWAAGLLTALAELRATNAPVLLVAYDHPLPPPLDRVRPTGPAFAAALVLAPHGPGQRLAVTHDPECPAYPPALPNPDLQTLARSNPAAHALPLLVALAAGRAQNIDVAYLEGRLRLELSS